MPIFIKRQLDWDHYKWKPTLPHPLLFMEYLINQNYFTSTKTSKNPRCTTKCLIFNKGVSETNRTVLFALPKRSFLYHIINHKLYFLREMEIQHVIICYQKKMTNIDKKIFEEMKVWKGVQVEVMPLRTGRFY